MNSQTIGFAMTGSFCTFRAAEQALYSLKDKGWDVIPIMSEHAYALNTRFGNAEEHVRTVEKICERPILKTIQEVEPLGPEKKLDLLVIAPCTGNSLAKLASGIADTAVTFACKAHLRNQRPVVIGISTNDGLAAAAGNIGALLNRKHYFFVPFGQDDPVKKPNSLAADLTKLPDTIIAALNGIQYQPILR